MPTQLRPSVSGINHLTINRVTTGMDNLEMSGILTAVREISGIFLKVQEGSCKKILSGKSGLKLTF